MNIKKLSLVVLSFYLIAGLFYFFTPKREGLYVRIFDVGQGDSIFIRTKGGHTILIDGGGNSEADSKLNSEIPFPFCRVDYVFLTHFHSDHLLGLNKILQRCDIGLLIFNDVTNSSSVGDDFKQLAKKINTKNVFAGDEFVIDEARLKILWPPKEIMQEKVTNENNNSVVIFLDAGSFEGLFLGDLETEGQERLNLDSIEGLIDGGLDILKVAHHGALNGTSVKLLEQVRPLKCAISVGDDNKYGHPSAKALSELEKVGCQVERTDQLGDIVINAN